MIRFGVDTESVVVAQQCSFSFWSTNKTLDVFDQPPYYPDLAPSDHYLFPQLKETDDEVEAVKAAWLVQMDTPWYTEDITKLLQQLFIVMVNMLKNNDFMRLLLDVPCIVILFSYFVFAIVVVRTIPR